MSDPSDPAVWYVRSRGREYGPLTGAALRQMAETNRIGPTDAVRKIGGPWKPTTEVKGLLPDAAPDPSAVESLGVLGAAHPTDPPPSDAAETITPADLAAAGVAPVETDAGGRDLAGRVLFWTGLTLYVLAGLMVAAGVLAAVVGTGSEDDPPDAGRSVARLVLTPLIAAVYALPFAVAGYLCKHLADRPERRAEIAARWASGLLLAVGLVRLAWLWALAPWLTLLLGSDNPFRYRTAGTRYKDEFAEGATANAAEVLVEEAGGLLMVVAGLLLLGFVAVRRTRSESAGR